MISNAILASSVLLLTLCHFSRSQVVLKCLVCKQVVKDLETAVSNENPKKTIKVGFRIQPDGSQKESVIKYAGSEIHLHEVLEKLCDKMDDYAQAKDKSTGELAILNLSKDIEKLSTHELVPDADLNRSLKYYCETFIEEHEEDIISSFKSVPDSNVEDLERKLCAESAGYCKAAHSEL